MESENKADKARVRRRRRAVPLDLRLLGFFAARLGRAAPRLIGGWTYRTWVKTRRFPAGPGEAAVLAKARFARLSYAGRGMAVYAWGNGPTVLLVHGWNGRGAQLGHFVAPLVSAGYRVVAFDAPGHGRTGGRRTDIAEYTGAIGAVAAAYGPVVSAISHSFGAICLSRALSQGLPLGRVVYIGAPARYEGLVAGFARRLGLPRPARVQFRRLLEQRFATSVWRDFSLVENATQMSVSTLVVHDRNDRAVPYTDAQAIAEAWPNARLLLTRGLGHQRVLRDAEVVREVVEFVRGQ